MSRNVDWTDPTDDDLAWAVEWEQWHAIQQAGFDVKEVRQRYGAGTPAHEPDPYGTAEVPRVGSDNEMRVNPETQRPETVGTGQSASEVDPDNMPDDYNDWKVADLRAELKDRQLPADGNKDELIARLMEDNEENPADD
jgi:hypothetical protein